MALLVGCDSNPVSPELHECEPYESTPVEESITGAFIEPNDRQFGSMVVPEDPGGGYVEFTMTTTDSELAPGVIVQTVETGDAVPAILSGTAQGQDDPLVREGGFAVAPGRQYELTFTQGINADPDNYPVEFTFAWSYTGTDDCYEGNDSPADAKQVPVGTTVKAYAMAGYTDNVILSAQYDDWYKVVINRSASVEAEMTVPPAGYGALHRMRIRFWNEDGSTQLANNGGNGGGETFTTAVNLEPGTYLMSVEVASGEGATWSYDDPVPGHWSTPYSVELREAEVAD